MTKTIFIKVGTCSEDRLDVRVGAKFDNDKVHNCNTCGYYNSYNDEMIELNTTDNTVVWSSVK